MKQIFKRTPILITVLLIILIVFGLLYLYQGVITTFDQCTRVPGSTIDSDKPVKCITLSGRQFIQPILNPKDKNLIKFKIDDLRAVLAIYYLDNNKYPESLDNLVPKYMVNMPIDPFTNNPYLYTVNSDKSAYIISIKFDDGKVYAVSSKSKPGNY